MFAVDDGIADGNLTAADIFFFIAVVLAIIYIVFALKPPRDARIIPACLGLCLACGFFGLFLL